MTLPGVVGVLCAAAAVLLDPSAARSLTQGQVQPIQTGFGAGAYPRGAAYPKIKRIVRAAYPEAAIRAGIEGEVFLEAVVGADGAVTDVRIVKSLDAATGLDDSAVAAMRKWTFEAGTIAGRKVGVVVSARVAYYLRQPGKQSGKPFVEGGLTGDSGSPEWDTAFKDVLGADAPGVTAPMVIRDVRPQYTSEAMRQKIQGRVVLEVVVGIDGRVTAARVAKSLDRTFGLDRQALAAGKEWQFTPARRNGAPIPVRVMIDLEFRLH